jgi:hypothetical protein
MVPADVWERKCPRDTGDRLRGLGRDCVDKLPGEEGMGSDSEDATCCGVWGRDSKAMMGEGIRGGGSESLFGSRGGEGGSSISSGAFILET